MGLFRPYERKSPDAPGTAEPEDAKSGGRISSLTPKGVRRAEKHHDDTPEASAPPKKSPQTTKQTTKVVPRAPQKKQGATPTRKQAEAERMQRLHPSLDKKDQRRLDKNARYKSRIEGWDKVESSPERVLLRDFVDVRWTVTEFMLPAMLVLMAATVATSAWPSLSFSVGIGLWVLMALSFINTATMWISFKKLLAERVPGAGKRGLLMYMFNRSLMIRRFRRPGPRVKRGESI